LNGLGPTVFGYGIEGAMKFGVYEIMKPIFLELLGGTSNNKVVAFMLASFIAGAVAAVLLVPMESLRIKQVTDPSYKKENIVSGLPRIIRQDGFFIMMSGVWAMLAKQVPYTFGKQVSFDLIAKFLYEISNKIDALSTNQIKWIVSIFSAFFASIVACLFSQPGDMILTETYNTNGGKPGDFSQVINKIYNSPNGGGISEFFRGTKARIVHVGMIITSQLVVYDLVKQLLGLPATGSH
jgi:solute carrier family 25 phosphate transporter 3